YTTLFRSTWEISWEAPCYAPNVTRSHQSYLYNVTDNAVVARGIGAQFDDGDGGDGSSTMSCGSAVVSISSSKTFEIRSNTSGSLTQGVPTSFGTQVLTRV